MSVVNFMNNNSQIINLSAVSGLIKLRTCGKSDRLSDGQLFGACFGCLKVKGQPKFWKLRRDETILKLMPHLKANMDGWHRKVTKRKIPKNACWRQLMKSVTANFSFCYRKFPKNWKPQTFLNTRIVAIWTGVAKVLIFWHQFISKLSLIEQDSLNVLLN